MFSHCFSHSNKRRGTFLALMAFLLPALLIIAAFTINIAFIQLTKTELMVATDAAARAGGRAMSSFQNIDDAMEAAQITAALNTVNGIPLQLDSAETVGDIEFGDAEPSSNSNRFDFEQISRTSIYSGEETAAAIRINGRLTSSSLSGPVSAFFPTFGLQDQFDLNQAAVAMQVDRDIALILDRSGSMDVHPGWDWPRGFNPWTWDPIYAAHEAGLLSYDGRRFYYNSGQNSETLQDWMWTEYLGLGEEPKRPWEELVEAVDVFLNVLETTDQEEQVSVASYATSASLDIQLQSNYNAVRNEIATLSATGWTAIGEGMNAGVPSLLDSFARPYAAKTLLVMTDGVHNTGVDPDEVAESIVADYDIIIHTITFGNGADQENMLNVATIGGGAHYHADDGDELNAVFEEIANNLPTIVIQ
ncbi:MAG: vWA domain-containing protein [Planctomycetota bacterium]